MLRQVFLYTIKSIGIILSIVLAAGLAHFFILEISEVNGRSMEDTLQDADFIIIDKLSLLFRSPERGDLVTAFADYEDLVVVKRVIGLPGEQVVIKNGHVYIRDISGNEFELEEPYIQDMWTYPKSGINEVYPILKEHQYFIMGDNRNNSTDSRAYGPVHRSQIIGRIFCNPIEHLSFIKNIDL